MGKEAEGYDNNDHNSMEIPDREFHYNVSSYLVQFQNIFILVILALFYTKVKESMGFCSLFVCLFV